MRPRGRHLARSNIANALLYQGNEASLIEKCHRQRGQRYAVTTRWKSSEGDVSGDHLFGLGGTDELDGGGGADFWTARQVPMRFRLWRRRRRPWNTFDTINNFDADNDVLSTAFAVTKVEKEIKNLGLGGTNFVTDMEAAGAGLGVHHAVLFTNFRPICRLDLLDGGRQRQGAWLSVRTRSADRFDHMANKDHFQPLGFHLRLRFYGQLTGAGVTYTRACFPERISRPPIHRRAWTFDVVVVGAGGSGLRATLGGRAPGRRRSRPA